LSRDGIVAVGVMGGGVRMGMSMAVTMGVTVAMVRMSGVLVRRVVVL
jgi:hypothetical protein